MALSPEAIAQIDQLRTKARAGQTLSVDETRAAIRLMREDRIGAAATSANSRAKKAKAAAGPVSGDDLLKDFM